MTSINPYRLAAKVCRQPVWHFRAEGKRVFLTFDDGPSPALTPWILDVLSAFGARATFFCLGRQVERHPALLRAIRDAGHSLGNHTYSHLKGWRTSNRRYDEDVRQAADVIPSGLFRPPYGQIRPSQVLRLRRDYRIVMWDVLSRDYDKRLSPQAILEKLKRRVRPGSIVVFHDSPKAETNLRAVLPDFLEFCKAEGYEFSRIEF